MLRTLALRVEDDIGNRLPLAGGSTTRVQGLDAGSLLVGVKLARLGERGFIGRELLNDVVDAILGEIGIDSLKRTCAQGKPDQYHSANRHHSASRDHSTCIHTAILFPLVY